jgi:hypothetical protein
VRVTVYATVDELRGQIDKTSDDDDAHLTKLLTWASEAVDRFCRRSRDGFVAAAVASARQYSPRSSDHLFLDECTQVTLVEVRPSLTEDYVEWAASDWLAAWGDPANPRYDRTPYTLLLLAAGGAYRAFTTGAGYTTGGVYVRNAPTVRVTAKWGYADTVPGPVALATIMQAARWHKRLHSAMASSVGSAEMGTSMRYEALDPDVGFNLVKAGLVRASE